VTRGSRLSVSGNGAGSDTTSPEAGNGLEVNGLKSDLRCGIPRHWPLIMCLRRASFIPNDVITTTQRVLGARALYPAALEQFVAFGDHFPSISREKEIIARRDQV
jgi:hypothetical protein